jgi:hypothetical protein
MSNKTQLNCVSTTTAEVVVKDDAYLAKVKKEFLVNIDKLLPGSAQLFQSMGLTFKVTQKGVEFHTCIQLGSPLFDGDASGYASPQLALAHFVVDVSAAATLRYMLQTDGNVTKRELESPSASLQHTDPVQLPEADPYNKDDLMKMAGLIRAFLLPMKGKRPPTRELDCQVVTLPLHKLQCLIASRWNEGLTVNHFPSAERLDQVGLFITNSMVLLSSHARRYLKLNFVFYEGEKQVEIREETLKR